MKFGWTISKVFPESVIIKTIVNLYWASSGRQHSMYSNCTRLGHCLMRLIKISKNYRNITFIFSSDLHNSSECWAVTVGRLVVYSAVFLFKVLSCTYLLVPRTCQVRGKRDVMSIMWPQYYSMHIGANGMLYTRNRSPVCVCIPYEGSQTGVCHNYVFKQTQRLLAFGVNYPTSKAWSTPRHTRIKVMIFCELFYSVSTN